MQDRREQGRTIVYLAERGQTVESNGQAYLVLEKGSVHRQQPNSRDSSIVAFERYAVDLSAFNQDGGEVVYKPRERSTLKLLFPDESEATTRFRRSLGRTHDHFRLALSAGDDDRVRGHGRPGTREAGARRSRSPSSPSSFRIMGLRRKPQCAYHPVVAIYAVPLAATPRHFCSSQGSLGEGSPRAGAPSSAGCRSAPQAGKPTMLTALRRTLFSLLARPS
jgi:lipopolysaccharide export system permease protein